MNLAVRIEQASQRAGYHTRASLARACGVSPPSVDALVHGKRPMSNLLAKIAELTHVSQHWLRDGRPYDAPEWARDFANPDLEAFEQLRMHLVTTVPKEQQERIIPRHPTASDVARWVRMGRSSGWSGEEVSIWRGFCLATAQLEGDEIRLAVAADQGEYVSNLEKERDELRRQLHTANAALAKIAMRMAEPEAGDPVVFQPQSSLIQGALAERRRRQATKEQAPAHAPR